MSKIERVEVEIDRVIAYLDCGCIKKSDISLNAVKLAEVKRAVGQEICEKHQPLDTKKVFYCERCRSVSYINATREDTERSILTKITIIHDQEHPRCKGVEYNDIGTLSLTRDVTRESILESDGLKTWMKEPLIKLLGLQSRKETSHEI